MVIFETNPAPTRATGKKCCTIVYGYTTQQRPEHLLCWLDRSAAEQPEAQQLKGVPPRPGSRKTKQFSTFVSNAPARAQKLSSYKLDPTDDREDIQTPDTPRRMSSGSETTLFDHSDPTAYKLAEVCIFLYFDY